MRNGWLFAGGLLSAGASVLHLGCIVGGPAWYRFLGAGERMAQLAERGSLRPALITAFIAAVLAGWAAYAFSGAGLLPRLPLLRPILAAITAIYVLRAVALPAMLTYLPARGVAFLYWSSGIVAVFAIIHTIGLVTSWSKLAPGAP